jgi:hypothetical protein
MQSHRSWLILRWLPLIDMSGLFKSPGRTQDIAELKPVSIASFGSKELDKVKKVPLESCSHTDPSSSWVDYL